MQYETWGKSKETKKYEFIEAFHNLEERYSRLDSVDIDKYSEAMILRTEYNERPACVLYKEIDNESRHVYVKRK